MEHQKGQSGYLVETSSGKKGRTFHKNGLINGKMPVYLFNEHGSVQQPAVLVKLENVKVKGFVD